MNGKLSALILACFAAVSVYALEPQYIPKMVDSALNFPLSKSFKASGLVLNGQELDIVFFSKPGENIRFERFEAPVPNGDTRVGIYNAADGQFLWVEGRDHEIIGNTVMKTLIEYPGLLDFRRTIRLNMHSGVAAEYSVAEDEYNGIPCYKIWVIFPDDDDSVRTLSRIVPEQFEKYKDAARREAVTKILLWIGKGDNQFIYAYEFYDALGNKRESMQWNSVEFIPLSDELFRLPAGVTVEEAKTKEEVMAIANRHYAPRPLITTDASTIAHRLIYSLIAVALTIAVVVIIKMRKR